MSNKATQQERDFAIVMQQLSAEAEKILPGDQNNSLPEVRDPTEPGQQPDANTESVKYFMSLFGWKLAGRHTTYV
jgi:hypothetical protein